MLDRQKVCSIFEKLSTSNAHKAFDPEERSDEGPAVDEKCYVYIIECRDKKLYVGIAKDVEERVHLHNQGLACRFTKYRCPVKLLLKEEYSSRSAARIREIELKGFSKKKKQEIIERFFGLEKQAS